ncbi:MAG: Ni/Fe hydrogenase subunit alpha, partial [Blastocatellia bacterium]
PRYALNFDCLPELVQEAAREVRLGPVVRNPFQSIVVRSLEVLFAVEESIRLIEGYQVPAGAAIPYAVSAGTGHAATEAPRGICYHRYQVDAAGLIEAARIVPPTSQNQKTIEGDLWGFVPRFLHLPDDQLQWQCEQAVRNYDPCISCATHFLRLTVERT